MAIPVSDRPRAGVRTPALLLGTVLWSFAGGVATSVGQGWLPSEAGSLANSAGPWCAIAFLSALAARRVPAALASASLALAALVAGYYVTSQLSGFAVGLRTVAFWSVAALFAGPVLGLSAHVVRHGRGLLVAAACGVPAGLLVGEGVYGLVVVADTTYPPYWWAEVATGAVLLVVLGAVRLHRPAAVAAAVAAAAVVATVVFTLMNGDLLASF